MLNTINEVNKAETVSFFTIFKIRLYIGWNKYAKTIAVNIAVI